MSSLSKCVSGSWLSILIGFALISPDAAADSDRNTCYINIDPHPCIAAEDPVKACTKALDNDPYDLQTRLTLCGAHLQNQENEESKIDAYIVVKKGIELCGSDAYICQRYKYAKSMIEESDEGGRRQQVVTARERCDYGRELCLSRLTSSLGVRGCDMAMFCDAEDPLLYAKKGEKLLARNSPAESVRALSRAAELEPDNSATLSRLAAAQQARAALAADCIEGDSLEDCTRALLAGEPDEFDLQYRRGQLLVAEDRQTAALQAFTSAQNLDPDNEDLARTLLGLLDPAIRDAPNDADYRRTQGLALLAIGSTNDSILAFRKADQLNPDDGDTARGLAAARAERTQAVKRKCLSNSNLKACDAMILAGEPDEGQIREHMARILRDRNELDAALAEAKAAKRLSPGNASIVALIAGIQELQAPPAPVTQAAEVETAADPETTPTAEQFDPNPIDKAEAAVATAGAAPASIIYSNAASEDGRTY